jgi:hypothetical protein
LMTHDLSGINFHEAPARHFGGNFWWARADYIRRLPHPLSPDFASPQFADPSNRERIRYEMWVGSGNPKVCNTGVGGGFGHDLYSNDIYPFIPVASSR